RQAGAAALADVPGQHPDLAHGSAQRAPRPPPWPLPGPRPLTAAPASGDIRRKNGTATIAKAPTMTSAIAKSAGARRSAPCAASRTERISAPIATPAVCDNCWHMLVRLVARLSIAGGTSA